MNHIQTDVSDDALTTAIRLNMCELFRYASKCYPAEQFESERFMRWHTPLAFPWFNGVLCSSPPTEEDESFIREAIQYFRDKKVSVFTWWMEPHLTASDWEAILFKHRFGFSNASPGMAVHLHALTESASPVKELEIRVVADDESMHIWTKTFLAGYGLPMEWEDRWVEVWGNMGLDFPARNYLGYWNAKPVSTSSVFFGGGVAGIYCVATLPEARGKGIGSAMTLKPLKDAAAIGYRIEILQSSEMGFSIYKHLGFRHLCQIENFYLSL